MTKRYTNLRLVCFTLIVIIINGRIVAVAVGEMVVAADTREP